MRFAIRDYFGRRLIQEIGVDKGVVRKSVIGREHPRTPLPRASSLCDSKVEYDRHHP
jgi:hypothetical protein